ncbi:calcium uptake protein 3, mitochondrial-like [Orbicella faveolata]|uniref:calcium uptake protein 3, mitochondrial-like n=1 Tax=Orbicella faveolata TaxID=48498 RepID=UPI0009E2C350|nr:calcium uptake protein 3, mitochondrial-like [Orbicella faveolata]
MFSSLAGKTSLFRVTLVGIGGVSCCLLWKIQTRNSSVNVVLAKSTAHHSHVHSQTRRKSMFEQFASIEFDGQYFMTPADFLESLTYRDLPGWSRKRPLSEAVISQMVKSTPSISKGSRKFFRTLQDNGIITFSEYLFLLTILTKSKRGLEIAFKMLDKDGNGRLTKDEFFVLEEMVNKKSSAKSMALRESEKENGDCRNNTTLKMHFFGSRGTGQLTFSQFSKFMQDFQLEVFEMEFMEYSRGMPTIPEDSFGRLLLRNTSLEEEEIQKYLDRLCSRLRQRKGITLEQFLSFGMFLNNLEDFALAMRIYSIAGQAVTEEEFQRAVYISTGQMLDSYVVHTVFELFDKDGDGKLSYGEFIELMKDRINRGFRVPSSEKSGWQGFKQCVKKEMSL